MQKYLDSLKAIKGLKFGMEITHPDESRKIGDVKIFVTAPDMHAVQIVKRLTHDMNLGYETNGRTVIIPRSRNENAVRSPVFSDLQNLLLLKHRSLLRNQRKKPKQMRFEF